MVKMETSRERIMRLGKRYTDLSWEIMDEYKSMGYKPSEYACDIMAVAVGWYCQTLELQMTHAGVSSEQADKCTDEIMREAATIVERYLKEAGIPKSRYKVTSVQQEMKE